MGDYRRFPDLRRARLRSNQSLGGVSGEFVIAIVSALVATVWQDTHEAQTKTHLLLLASFSDLVVAAFVGAIGGLLLVRFFAFLIHLVLYRLSGWKDSTWVAGFSFKGDMLFFLLHCKVHPPASVASLGYMECLVIDGAGRKTWITNDHLAQHADPVGVAAKIWAADSPGPYEVRWYGSTERRHLYEITRAVFDIRDDQPVQL
ncbi:MAG TPA: hypothetical protein VFW38_08395 [Solirubrobacteraceae bacterium]|nr:hypothetical protein [Solirubrobacteraceae bacterium]